jgi:tetratricopeptide (TPR) repeat protein
MAGNVFINYRRDQSGDFAGRLHDRLGSAFGRKKIFMDVDNVPVGLDFTKYLNSQVAACDAMLSIIGPNWLNATDENGQRRLDDPNDFVALEIAAALARDIPVVPVLTDGARMPKESELPGSLKPLTRRNAVQVHRDNFGSDAEALIKKLREALDRKRPIRALVQRWDRKKVMVCGAVLIGIIATAVIVLENWSSPDTSAVDNTAAKSPDNSDTAVKPDLCLNGEAKRYADELERRERAALKAQQEPETDYSDRIQQGRVADICGQVEKALKNFSEAIRLNPSNPEAFYLRCRAYRELQSTSAKDHTSEALADCDQAVRLDPKSAVPLVERGAVYAAGFFQPFSREQALADYNQAIRLDPKYATSFLRRGFYYEREENYDRAIADFNEAVRLDPNFALAFCARGWAKQKIKDSSSDADFEKGRQLNAFACSGY